MAAIVLWPIFFQLPISLGIFFYGAFMAYYIVVVWSETGPMLTFLLLHLILILWTVQFIKVKLRRPRRLALLYRSPLANQSTRRSERVHF